MANNINPALLNLFLQGRRITYKKGEIILRPEERPSGVYLVYEGYPKVFSITQRGEESLHIVRRPGEVFPITWSLTGSRRDLYYQAMDDVVLYRITSQDFAEAFDSDPEVSHAIINQFIAMLSTLYDRINNLQLRTASEKVAYRLLALNRRVGLKREDGTYLIQAPVRHHDVADSLSMSRETVSRELGELAKAEIIGYEDQKIVIKDIAALERIVE